MGLPKNRKQTPSFKQSEKAKTNTDGLPPRFLFRHLVKHPNFCYKSLDDEHKIALVDTMHQLSQYTWAEINVLPRHKKGFEKIQRSSLKFNLHDEITKDCDIIAFRFCGDAPMLGYRSDGDTFFIIAFDTKFKAYSH